MTKDNIWFVSDFGRGLYAFDRTKNLVSDDNWIVEKCDSHIADIVSYNDVTVTYHMYVFIFKFCLKFFFNFFLIFFIIFAGMVVFDNGQLNH